jgi:hypothetical protein
MTKQFIMFKDFIIDKNTIVSATKKDASILVTTIIDGKIKEFEMTYEPDSYQLDDDYLRLHLSLDAAFIGRDFNQPLVQRLRFIEEAICELRSTVNAALRKLNPKKKAKKEAE